MVAMATVCASKKLPRVRGIIRMKTTLIVRALIPASRHAARGVGSIGVSCAADCPFFVPFASKLYVILAILSMAKGCDLLKDSATSLMGQGGESDSQRTAKPPPPVQIRAAPPIFFRSPTPDVNTNVNTQTIRALGRRTELKVPGTVG
jgi:hypothetical protein